MLSFSITTASFVFYTIFYLCLFFPHFSETLLFPFFPQFFLVFSFHISVFFHVFLFSWRTQFPNILLWFLLAKKCTCTSKRSRMCILINIFEFVQKKEVFYETMQAVIWNSKLNWTYFTSKHFLMQINLLVALQMKRRYDEYKNIIGQHSSSEAS